MSAGEEAAELVSGERQLAYGHPRDNHGCTAALWSAYLSRRLDMPIAIDAEDVCWLNILQKASRQANLRIEDNVVDVIGYALNVEMLADAPVDHLVEATPAPCVPPLVEPPVDSHRSRHDEVEEQSEWPEHADEHPGISQDGRDDDGSDEERDDERRSR